MMPKPNPPPDDMQALQQAQREAELKKAAELGQKRSEREAAIRTELKKKQEEELAQGRVMVEQEEQRKADAKEETKEWRRDEKARKREADAERERREKEAKALEEEQQAIREKREAQKKYMKDLHDASAEKYQHEREKYEAEKLKAHLKSLTDHKAALERERIDRDERQQLAVAEEWLRAKKAVLEDEKKRRLYETEQWHRMRLFSCDADMKNVQAKARIERDAQKSSRMLATAQTENRKQRKLIEQELGKRTLAIDSDIHLQLSALIREHTEKTGAIHTTAVQQKEDNARKLRRTLEDIDHGIIKDEAEL